MPLEQIVRVASAAATVFIAGESGAGKELIARIQPLAQVRGAVKGCE
ncbi:MAG: sigma 54-interacting transcriptional regulator [Gammaproteobacteria bacterium]